MEEDIKNDLVGIAFTRPFFSDIVNNTLNYIEKLEQENEELRDFKERTLEIDNKEVSDALHMLLHCSLKDIEYQTQKQQFQIVNAYIKQLEEENQSKQKAYDDCYCEYKHYKQFDSIPKSKVKEKIEEYKNEIGQLRIERNVTYDSGIYKLELKREALQELLGEE